MPTPDVLRSFASKKVFFGHQSVGYNILDGLAALRSDFMAAGASAPAIREIATADQIDGAGVYHARAGKNHDPLSKIASFETMLVANGLGAKLDVAVLKFCYVDFHESVDANVVIDAYTSAITRIEAACPNLIVVHATCPLTTHTWGPKSYLRNIIKGDVANSRRAIYNDLLRGRLETTSALFDVSGIESTRPDGSLETFRFQGQTLPALYRGYTNDGGHLNDDGAKRAAIALITTVVNAQ